MSRRRRGLTEDEQRLWSHAVRDATPLRETVRSPLAKPAKPEPAEPPSTKAAIGEAATTRRPAPGDDPSPQRARHSHALDPRRPIDMDRRSWQRLKRGVMTVDARLDLHGLTQAEAHARLDRFLATQQARGARCLLVITGQGHRHGGVLRKMTPRWLDTDPNRSRILAYAPAQLRHGGDGALYVLLRRKR